MEIVKLIKKNKNVYQVKFSDNTSLNFYDDTIINYNLLVNKEISDLQIKEIINYNNKIDAYYKALSYINVKLRTKNEIRKKLKDYDKNIIDEVIEKLESQKYLDDELYIKSYINDQINLTLNGPKKILFELEKLGFKDIYKYMYMFDDVNWQEKIEKIISKKVKSNHNLSVIMLKNKIKNDLINLGYSKDLFQDVVENYVLLDNEEIINKEINKFKKKYKNKYSEEEMNYKLKYYLNQKGFNTEMINDLLNK